ncbi:MAG TPA: hypothetical protein VLW85_12625 [Myxococcales bacterium]|nr:hypothetical protein [Myxococcales bacterium]
MKRAALLAFALAACSGSAGLEGSLGADVSLAYTSIEIQRTPTAIAVIWLSGQDVVLKVTASSSGLNLDAGGLTIDLAETVNGAQRGSVVRVVSGDTRSTLPAIEHGTLTFDQAPVAGKNASGRIDILFQAGAAFGSGKTVFGSFSAAVTVPGQ